MTTDTSEIERRLWAAADQLGANSGLKPSEYSEPVLGLLFLRYAEKRFPEAEERIGPVGSLKPSGRREVTPQDYIREGIVYLPPEVRFAMLSALPEGADLGKALNEAMRAIEEANPDLAGVLSHTNGESASNFDPTLNEQQGPEFFGFSWSLRGGTIGADHDPCELWKKQLVASSCSECRAVKVGRRSATHWLKA